MENELIKHIGYKEIIDLISQTEDNLIISLPNIYVEISDSIIEYSRKIKKLKLINDNSEDNFRNGYGDYKDVEKLRSNNIEIYEIKGNMVSFIISDEKGYFLFPQSRIFSSEEDLSSNAVLMDAVTLINIKSYFFPPENEKEKEDYINEIIEVKKYIDDKIKHAIDNIENKTEIPFKPKKFNDNNFESVKQKLVSNPPDHPDLKRKISTYITKVQFVELSFEGEHFNTKDVHIPSKILPFKDKELQKKLIAKMKLFGNITEEKVYKDSFSKLSEDIVKIRKDYLVPLTSRKGKSIIKVENKVKFQDRIKTIIEKLPDLGSKLKAVMKQQILNSKKRIKDELTLFLIENPPDNLKDYTRHKTLFKNSVKDEIEKLVNTVKFPEPHNILNKIKIKYHYFDLTFDDLSDDELLNEFKNKKIMSENDINSIVEIKKAYEAKK